MEENLLRNIITSLNKPAFSKFMYDLWYFKDSKCEFETAKTYYLPKVGNDIFEHHKTKYTTKEKILIENQIYTVIVPFFYPVELFNNINLINNQQLLPCLKKYKRIVDKREASWFYPADGMYYIPNVAFVSNYSGLNENTYQNVLIPAFQKLIDEIELDAQVAIGTIDSFLEMEKHTTMQVLSQFMEKYKSEIVISFDNGINVDNFVSEKYLTQGVLKNSLCPCEPIFQIRNKNDLIKEFEQLLNYNPSEAKLEAFLKKYFKEIFDGYDRIETQIWLRFPDLDIGNKNRRLDIFLRNAISHDWELFELKKAIQLTHTHQDIPVFVNAVYLGIEQIRNYKRILSQDKVKKTFALQGIEYYEPEYRLLIGRNPDISINQWRNLKKSHENDLKILTWDDILNGMRDRSVIQNQVFNKLI
jgi:hypothetical protein